MDPFVGDIYYDNEQNDRTDALLLHLRVPENRFRFFPLKIPKGGFHRIGQNHNPRSPVSFSCNQTTNNKYKILLKCMLIFGINICEALSLIQLFPISQTTLILYSCRPRRNLINYHHLS